MNSNAQDSTRPSVLFVCVKNGGKSQMAAGLMKLEVGDSVTVTSAGTKPGSAVNALSAEVLQDLGADITAEEPTLLTEDDMRAAGNVVVIGTEAQVPEVDGVHVEVWETDEPSLRGIEGRARIELVRDDIHSRIKELKQRLLRGRCHQRLPGSMPARTAARRDHQSAPRLAHRSTHIHARLRRPHESRVRRSSQLRNGLPDRKRRVNPSRELSRERNPVDTLN